jgi:hypothetical protein
VAQAPLGINFLAVTGNNSFRGLRADKENKVRH